MKVLNLMTYGAAAISSIVALSFALPPVAFALEQVVPVTLASGVSSSAPDKGGENQQLVQSIKDKLDHLKSLGGGIKPFYAILAAIENGSNAAQAAEDLRELDQRIEEQITAVSNLRTKTRVLPATPGARQVSATFYRGDGEGGAPASMSRPIPVVLKPAAHGSGPIAPAPITATFQGSADGYYDLLVNEVLGKELGGLGFPCKGPFRLERFRLLQRIQELRASGTKVDGYLAYYQKIEDVAGRARKDHTRLTELGGHVTYLQQQLGLSTLTGSLHRDVR